MTSSENGGKWGGRKGPERGTSARGGSKPRDMAWCYICGSNHLWAEPCPPVERLGQKGPS
jgi:hypothetical protein